MLRPQGYLLVDDPDPRRGMAARAEADTFTCAHCGRLVMVRPMCDPADAGGLCRHCAGLICPACAARGHCDPLEEKLARHEARHHALRSYGLMHRSPVERRPEAIGAARSAEHDA